MAKKNPRQQKRLADMSLPPEERGRRGRGRRRAKRIGGTPPAQLDHAPGAAGSRQRREGTQAAARRRGRDETGAEPVTGGQAALFTAEGATGPQRAVCECGEPIEGVPVEYGAAGAVWWSHAVTGSPYCARPRFARPAAGRAAVRPLLKEEEE